MHVAGLGIAVLIVALVLGMWAFGGWMPGMGGMGPGMPGMGPHMGGRPGAPVPAPAPAPPVPGAGTIMVEAGDFSFRPAEVRVTAGRPINIALTNRGAIFHDLTIPAQRFQVQVQPGQRVDGSLPALPRGTYEFYCSVPGHREAGMVGRLVVAP